MQVRSAEAAKVREVEKTQGRRVPLVQAIELGTDDLSTTSSASVNSSPACEPLFAYN
jgi:hypothetical protein